MKMKQEIQLEERRIIQLEMLDEIHDLCVSNNIRYSLAFGTLLGAIRHKGYIPWDDDVDIMMPLSDMFKFKEILNSANIKFCDIETEPHFEYVFSRVSHKHTYKQVGLTYKSYGINIDLYPVVSLPDSEEKQREYFEKGLKLNEYRYKYMKWRERIIHRLPVSTIIGFDNAIKRARNYVLLSTPAYGSTSTYFVVAMPFSKKHKVLHHIDLFDKIEIVPFEDRNYNITSHHHEFLSKMYGDYMQFPPISERHPYHGGTYYWNDK